MGSIRRHRALLLALLGGLVFALTSPPTDVYPAVVVGLALFAASLGAGAGDAWPDPPTFLRAFARGAVWATAAGIIGLRFVPAVIQRFTPLGAPLSYLALVLLAAFQSLIWALGAGVTSLLARRARLPFEIAFGAGVLVALELPTIFAWSPAGLVSPWPAFVQLADIIGERGVSVIFAVGAALFARAAHRISSANPREALRPALAGLALFTALPIHGALRIRSITRASAALPTVRVGLVDQAVKPLDRWNRANHHAITRTLRSLTRTLEAQGAELVVWPEAAYPHVISHDARTAPSGPKSIVGNGVRGPVVAGLIMEDPPFTNTAGDIEQSSYNSAALVSPDGSMSPPYDKMELLWFGETVPLGAQIPWLRRTFQRSGGLVSGAAPRSLDVDRGAGAVPVRMAVLNCYEDTLPSLGRTLANALAPTLLVNVTNDAWFYATAEPALHARLGAMRAIELRRDLVRAVNYGETSWIDAAGLVRARYDAEEPGTLLVTPALRVGVRTWYQRLGDTPIAVFIAALTLASSIRSKRRERMKAA